MPADPAILQRIRGCPFARGGRVLVRFRANGYSLLARHRSTADLLPCKLQTFYCPTFLQFGKA